MSSVIEEQLVAWEAIAKTAEQGCGLNGEVLQRCDIVCEFIDVVPALIAEVRRLRAEIASARNETIEACAKMVEDGDPLEGHQAAGNAPQSDAGALGALRDGIVECLRGMVRHSHATPARLDADATANPLTEIVGVMPEPIGDGKTYSDSSVTEYVVRPTGPTERDPFSPHVAEGTWQVTTAKVWNLRRTIFSVGCQHFTIAEDYSAPEDGVDPMEYCEWFRDMFAKAMANLGAPPQNGRPWAEDGDGEIPEDTAINAAFPTRSGRHDIYGEAMRLVSAKRSKGALVALVNWLLHRAEVKP